MVKVSGVLFAALLVGCGDGDPGTGSGDGAGGDACSGSACGAVRVTVAVDSPLPAELSCGRSVAELDAFVLDVFDSGACFVSVSTAGVSGTCADVLADRNLQATLVFRHAGRQLPLAEQGRLLELPGTSPPTVTLSFSGVTVDTPYDSDSDGTDNLAEWCAGTL